MLTNRNYEVKVKLFVFSSRRSSQICQFLDALDNVSKVAVREVFSAYFSGELSILFFVKVCMEWSLRYANQAEPNRTPTVR